MWKDVTGYEGLYRVNDQGEVWSVRAGRRMRPMRTGRRRKQYSTVALCRAGAQRQFRVHQLVLEAFVGPRPEGYVACHRDDDTLNNTLGNLYWGTWQDNARDIVRAGNHAHQRITLAQRAEIRRRRATGESGKSLAAEFGVSQQTVCDIFKGRKAVYE